MAQEGQSIIGRTYQRWHMTDTAHNLLSHFAGSSRSLGFFPARHNIKILAGFRWMTYPVYIRKVHTLTLLSYHPKVVFGDNLLQKLSFVPMIENALNVPKHAPTSRSHRFIRFCLFISASTVLVNISTSFYTVLLATVSRARSTVN